MSDSSSSHGEDASVADARPRETAPGAAPEASSEPSPEASAKPGEQATQGNPRYASQADAAQPAPIAFEGGASEPSSGEGTTPRREWFFLALATFFSVVFVTIPAVLFTGLDLTATTETEQAPPEGSSEAREIERLQLLQETRSDALAKLYTYGPTENGTFRIPLEEAMRLTLRENDAGAASGGALSAGSGLKLAIPGGARPGRSSEADSTAFR